MNPRFPIYVPSKGRWNVRLTQKSLERMQVPYFVVVEPQEFERYDSVTDHEYGTVLILPFSNLGQGVAPARNWIKDHSIKELKAEYHWQIDDDMRKFYRLNRNREILVGDGTIFRAAEDFVYRYANIGLAGFHDYKFVPRKEKCPPFFVNRRAYSTLLINNATSHYFRPRYNEDTDFNIRVMKDGWCVVNFLAFLANTEETRIVPGGMTDLYAKAKGKEDGRLKMAIHLRDQHPDITKITWRFNHWQHLVDYTVFDKNELKLKSGIVVPEGNDEYGMKLVEIR